MNTRSQPNLSPRGRTSHWRSRVTKGRTVLVLGSPGGEPLDRVLERDREQPLDLALLPCLDINLATALAHAHQRGLIHKDVKSEKVLADNAGHAWLTSFGIASRLPR